MRRPVFLLTDFGLQDAFVGIMKAVLCRLAPGAPIHDLTHFIPPQNVPWGALVLEDALPFLPLDSVVCAVVDPGVGGSRAALAVELAGRTLIAPDNGLLWPAIQRSEGPFQAFSLLPGEHIRPHQSATFHGRDVFAPAAALRAIGTPPEQIGKPVRSIQRIEFPAPESRGKASLRLTVLASDHYGNLALNLRRGETATLAPWLVEEAAVLRIESRTVLSIQRTFGDVAPGETVAYWNSAGRLELAINGGNARKGLGLEPGAEVLLLNE